jgi:hypothetical protein
MWENGKTDASVDEKTPMVCLVLIKTSGLGTMAMRQPLLSISPVEEDRARVALVTIGPVKITEASSGAGKDGSSSGVRQQYRQWQWAEPSWRFDLWGNTHCGFFCVLHMKTTTTGQLTQ